jgi:hypothetical protein
VAHSHTPRTSCVRFVFGVTAAWDRTHQEPPYARARGTDQEAPAEPRRLQPSANFGGSRWASVYPTCAFFVWPLVGPSVPPEALEAIRREHGVPHGRGLDQVQPFSKVLFPGYSLARAPQSVATMSSNGSVTLGSGSTFYNAPVAYCGPARPGSAFQQSAVSGLLPRARVGVFRLSPLRFKIPRRGRSRTRCRPHESSCLAVAHIDDCGRQDCRDAGRSVRGAPPGRLFPQLHHPRRRALVGDTAKT